MRLKLLVSLIAAGTLAACGTAVDPAKYSEAALQRGAANSCSLNDLGYGTSATCTGPWKYQDLTSDSSCGALYCPNAAYGPCNDWTFGATASPGIVVQMTRDIPLKTFCYRICDDPGVGTHPVCHTTCGPAPDPTKSPSDCNTAADTIVKNLQSNAKAQQTSEGALGIPEITKSSSSASAPNADGTTYVCTYTYTNQLPNLGTGAACQRQNPAATCSVAMVYPSCIKPTPVYTAPGLSSSQVTAGDPNARLMQCMTCEDIAEQQNVWKLFTCLQGMQADACNVLTGSAAAITCPQVISRQKELYELAAQGLDSSQRTVARALYTSNPTIVPSCNQGSVATCTDAASVGGVSLCSRLASSPAPVQALEVSACLAAAAAIPTSCPVDRFTARDAATQVVRGGFGAVQISSVQGGLTTDLAWHMNSLDSWYNFASTTVVSGKGVGDAGTTFTSSVLQGTLTNLAASLSTSAVKAHNVYGTFVGSFGDGGSVTDAGATSQNQLDTILGQTNALSQEVDQAFISAMYSPVATLSRATDNRTLSDGYPAHGLPLAVLTANSLQSMQNTLDQLSDFHDFACLFRGCTGQELTPIARFWGALGNLENQAGLTSSIGASNSWGDTTGWWAPLNAIAANEAILKAAALHESELPFGQRGLEKIISRARSASQSFSKNSQFTSTARNKLHAGIDIAAEQYLSQTIFAERGQLQADLASYDSNFLQAANSLAAELGSGASQAHIKSIQNQIVAEYANSNADRVGLALSFDQASVQFGNLMDGFRKDSVDSNLFSQVGSSVRFDLDGAAVNSAPINGVLPRGGEAGRITGGGATSTLSRGQILAIDSIGAWSPSCALSSIQSTFLGSLTGPEGYSVSNSNGTYTATSATETNSTDHSADVSLRGCVGPNGFWGSLQACITLGYQISDTVAHANGNGSEQRTSSAFSNGIRLDNTPFPLYPAGSLLVVITDPNNVIEAVEVLHQSHNSIIVPYDNTVAHLVVNDAICQHPPGMPLLTVNAQVEISGQALTAAALKAMSKVKVDMDLQEQALATAGVQLTVDQPLAIRSAARNSLNNLLPSPSTYGSLPSSLQELFDAFVDNEIARLELKLQIRAVERHMDADILQLAGISEDLALGAKQGELLAMIPRWAVSTLQGDMLRIDGRALTAFSRDYFYPVLKLWYPGALAALQKDINFTQPLDTVLYGTTLTSNVAKLSNQILLSTGAMMTSYAQAKAATSLGSRYVAVSFHNPSGPGMSGNFSGFDSASPIVSAGVWNAILNGGIAEFRLTPEDLYRQLSGQGDLDCSSSSAPVIKRMGLFFGRNDASNNPTANSSNLWINAQLSSAQIMAVESGPVMFGLDSPQLINQQIPIRYDLNSSAIDSVSAAFSTSASGYPSIGVSPFQTFSMNFSGFNPAYPIGKSDPSWLSEVPSEAVLVMEIESRGASSPLNWINSCSPPP